jgi:hypothetical protein
MSENLAAALTRPLTVGEVETVLVSLMAQARLSAARIRMRQAAAELEQLRVTMAPDDLDVVNGVIERLRSSSALGRS